MPVWPAQVVNFTGKTQFLFRIEKGALGKWTGQDNEKKQPSDIDVVGIDRVNKQAVIGECKFRNKQADITEIEALADRKRLVAPYDVKDMLYFSLGGYDKGVPEKGEKPGVRLLGISDIYA